MSRNDPDYWISIVLGCAQTQRVPWCSVGLACLQFTMDYIQSFSEEPIDWIPDLEYQYTVNCCGPNEELWEPALWIATWFCANFQITEGLSEVDLQAFAHGMLNIALSVIAGPYENKPLAERITRQVGNYLTGLADSNDMN